MSRRERLEAKLEKRLDWAEKADQRATQRHDAANKLSERFYGGQPIIVGHHSEKGARADQKRIHGHMDKALEESALAKRHAGAAIGIEHQLERSIFSDDDNAIEALEAKIADLERRHAHMKAANAAYRKRDAAALTALGLDLEKLDGAVANAYSWEKQPYPKWQMSNSSANINRLKGRIKEIQTMQARTEAAEAQGGITIERGASWCRVTFAEKPDRSTIIALKAAGFRWGAGSWCGPIAGLPEGLS